MLMLRHQDQGIPAKLLRSFKSKVTEHYSVHIDSIRDGIKSTYDYEIKWVLSPFKSDPDHASLALAFLNLRSSIDGKKAPVVKVFGAATYRVGVTGFPENFTLQKPIPFFPPVLSCFIPDSSSRFSVDPVSLDTTISATGKGRVKTVEDLENEVEIDLNLDLKDSAVEGETGTYHSEAIFLTKNATFLSATGSLKWSDASSVVFTIKRI